MRTIDKTISFRTANVAGSILTIPAIALFVIPFILITGQSISLTDGDLIALVIALVISTVIHEGLHGIGYKLGGASWTDIKFGVHYFTPYAHCKAPLALNPYRVAGALPGIILGIIPGLISNVIASDWLNLYGAFMFSAALGDVIILWLLRDAPANAQVLDHPSKVGCQLLLPE